MSPFCGAGCCDELVYFFRIFHSLCFHTTGNINAVGAQDADGLSDIRRIQAAGDEECMLRPTNQCAGSLPVKRDTGAARLSGDVTVQQKPTVGLRVKRRRVEAWTDVNCPDQRTIQIASVFGRLVAVQLDVIQLALFRNRIDNFQRLIDENPDFAGTGN